MSRGNVFTYRFPVYTEKKELNLIGFIIRNFSLIRGGEDVGFKSDCSSETKNTYIGLYNEYIFPLINPELPMNKYDGDVLNRLLSQIQSNNKYMDTTIASTFHNLVYDPYKYYCEYILGQTSNEKEKTDREQKDYVLIPKSLSISEINKLESLIMIPTTEDGALMGLSIMRYTGNRCNEACGYNFEDFMPMEQFETGYKAHTSKSTKINSNELKAGGKTSNAPRWIPVPTKLFNLIEERKRYICSVLEFPYEYKGTKYESVNKLPVVCRRNEYGNRCTTADLSRKGKEILNQIVTKSDMDGVQRFLNNPNNEIDPSEKDPTTYLLRRLYLTELVARGVNMQDATYIAGHELYDNSMKRWDYVDEHCLHHIWSKLEYEPKEQNEHYIFKKPKADVIEKSTYGNMFDNTIIIKKGED